MTWNYRIVHRTYQNGDQSYGVYEVYYGEAGKAENVTVDPASLVCYEALDDLRADLGYMLKAFDEPVLEYDDFD